MTEKELRKLSRVELLKLLVEVTEENEMLRAQLQGQQELSRRAQIQDSQEVRDSVEDVFRTVESTATGFLSKAQGIADQIIEDARVRADRMIHDAEARAAQTAPGAVASAGAYAAPGTGADAPADDSAVEPVEATTEVQEEPVIAPYEPFTAAAPQMQQVIEEITLEQSPQQAAEDAFATDALFAGTNATEVTEKRLTEVRVTEPAPLVTEEDEVPVVQQAQIAPAMTAAEPVEAPAAVTPAPAVYPEQVVPQEENFRIEGLEEPVVPQLFAPQAQAMPQQQMQQPDRPLTAIDMLKRLQGGS